MEKCETCLALSDKLTKGLCKRCYDKKRYVSLKEEISIINKQRYIDNRDEMLLRSKEWRSNNLEKAREASRNSSYKCRGSKPMDVNKSCPQYLGIHIAERVLSKIFKSVKVMSVNNPGYDFICGKGFKIDVKSACINSDKRWAFAINHNVTADYFLCLSFDNRNDLTPLHIWLIPGNDVNHKISIGISKSTLQKWSKYELDRLDKIISCCKKIRS